MGVLASDSHEDRRLGVRADGVRSVDLVDDRVGRFARPGAAAVVMKNEIRLVALTFFVLGVVVGLIAGGVLA